MSFVLRKFLSDHEGLTALAGVALLFILYFALRPPPSVRGERDAREDLALGHYVQLGYGLRTEWASEYDQCLWQRYGVEARIVAGDVLTESEHSYYYSVPMSLTNAWTRLARVGIATTQKRNEIS